MLVKSGKYLHTDAKRTALLLCRNLCCGKLCVKRAQGLFGLASSRAAFSTYQLQQFVGGRMSPSNLCWEQNNSTSHRLSSELLAMHACAWLNFAIRKQLAWL